MPYKCDNIRIVYEEYFKMENELKKNKNAIF